MWRRRSGVENYERKLVHNKPPGSPYPFLATALPPLICSLRSAQELRNKKKHETVIVRESMTYISRSKDFV
jgi:hypothetical protein